MADSQTYWARRIAKADAAMGTDERAIATRVRKAYETELARLSREIASYYKRYGEGDVLAYRTMLEAMDPEDRELLIKDCEAWAKAHPDLAHLVPVRKSIYKLDRLEGLQASARLHLARATDEATRGLDDHFARQAARSANAVAEAMGYGRSFYAVDDDAVRRFVGVRWTGGESYSDRIWGDTERVAAYVNDDLAKGIARGEGYARLAEQLGKRFVDVPERDVMRLVYTEGTYVARQSQLAELKREGFEEYRVEPIGDERTCGECRGMSAQTFRVEDASPGISLPPLHPNCRCQIAPAVDDWDAWARRQVDERRAELVAKRMGGVAEGESESWRQDTERRTVDMSRIRSKDYHSIVKRVLAGVDDVAQEDIERMLEHRSGTDLEDLYAYDMTAGKRIGSVVNATTPKRVDPTKSMVEKIVKAVRDGDDVAIVHNHPDSSPPSAADINSLVSTGAKRGVIACHDGSVYVYEVVREPAVGYTISDADVGKVTVAWGDSEDRLLKAFEDMLGVHVEHLR